jgi:hypothetical protein
MTKDLDYFKQIFDKVIVQLIWTGIVALATGIITFFVSRQFQFTSLEICLFVLLSVIFIIIASYLIYRRMNRRLPIYNPVDCDFHMIREERVHKWLNENDFVHKRRYTLKSLRNGLTDYVDKFMWTGTEFNLSGGDGDYTIEIDKCSKNIFTVYHFKFNTPLKKGEIIELEATWKAKGPAKPFFSTTIEEPTDILVMSIMLFPESGIREINCEMESYKGAKFPNEKQKQKLNSDGEFVWQVKNPKILHHYEINWKLNNNHSN